MTKERIAITGMGAVTPVGIGVASYWKNLIAGKSGVSRITRFDTSDLQVKIAAEVKDFNPTDFLPKKLVKNTDIFMQFALVAAQEALDQSKPEAKPERIGIVLGTALGGISSAAAAQARISEKGSYRLSPHIVPKMLGNIGAAQIAIMHGIKGPSITVNTACSSGADAIGTASMLLKADQADVVIAVGAESILSGLMAAGLQSARALSTNNDHPSEASRPFDLNRDGFVMGEGAGALVLEKMDRAQARNVDIQAELLGYANNTDAYHVTSPEPHGYGEIRCMQQAMDEAGVEPNEIGYINAHGTSTKLGDEAETTALKSLFGKGWQNKYPLALQKGQPGI
ncbi:beta-ketoacyl-[acyl-carrier-protein] synthase family protein [Virgibacillus sp. 179-BFC.A HS]|uniref:Beta-ketoacyl-[acyl-carrier-protein] synthase family protein n=1 Tax=Tigheibacillus jepli TaxID=3035914 RepID=A0ABU5CMH8_9BACI|nr:beta-ketoacyl-[acyl-carrier-protein] synthase family protein [Virgibacillus sp. 179-BFC.A HS]MDY0407096.1 beta-ketoacyl-[acyl-carrier-protein] synthase family protein [Virgibacillus sp. 179-BFC.A HS]